MRTISAMIFKRVSEREMKNIWGTPMLLFLIATLLIITSCSSISKVATIDGYEYVDMGLPSKTVWATCNVGARKSEEYGYFYAWGETKSKSDYSWSTYTLPCDSVTKDVHVVSNNHEETRMETYHRLSGRYTLDTETKNLLPENDAATVNWGKEWSTPTLEQWNELCDTTLCRWTQQKKGFLVTSKKNGKSIFLPSCGMFYGKEAPKTFLNEGDSVRYDGLYWSGTISGKDKLEYNVSYLRFDTGYQRNKLPLMSIVSDFCYGMSVRPVAKLPE